MSIPCFQVVVIEILAFVLEIATKRYRQEDKLMKNRYYDLASGWIIFENYSFYAFYFIEMVNRNIFNKKLK